MDHCYDYGFERGTSVDCVVVEDVCNTVTRTASSIINASLDLQIMDQLSENSPSRPFDHRSALNAFQDSKGLDNSVGTSWYKPTTSTSLIDRIRARAVGLNSSP